MVVVDQNKYDSKLMDADQTEQLFMIMWSEWSIIEKMWQDALDKDLFAAKIIQKRVDCFGLKLDSRVKLAAMIFCSSPGELVIFMYDILSMFGENSDIAGVFSDLYPMGFYSEQGFNQRWDYVKSVKGSTKYGKIV